MTLVYIEKER